MLDENFVDFREIGKEELGGTLASLNLQEVKLLPKSMKLFEAISYIRENKMNVLAVGDSLVDGIVTEDEFLKFVGSDFERMREGTLGDIINTSPTILDSDETIFNSIQIMGAKNIKHLIVKDGDKIRLLLLKDLLNLTVSRFDKDLSHYSSQVDWSVNGVYLQERPHFDDSLESRERVSAQVFETPLRKVMFNEACYCDIATSLAEAVEIMRNQGTASIILMEYETEMKGVLTSRDLLLKGYGLVDFSSTFARDVMTVAPHKLLEQDILAVAIKNMAKYNYRNVIICNQVGYPVSIVSILEMLRFICSKFL